MCGVNSWARWHPCRLAAVGAAPLLISMWVGGYSVTSGRGLPALLLGTGK